jgi:hypothetical protein
VKKTILCFGLSTFFILSSLVVSKVKAEEKLVFGTDIRLRYEFQENFNQKYYSDDPPKGSSDDGFLLGRFRAGFDYRPTETIRMALWIQHSDVWSMALDEGDFYNQIIRCGHNPNRDPWELSDTYIEIKRPFGFPIVFKGGRQRIVYGDKRVFGPGQWGNTGRWIWDALNISYRFEKGFVNTYYGKTMIHNPDKFSLNHRHSYESFGSYSHFTLPQNLLELAFEPFFMSKRDNHDRYKGEDNRAGSLDAYYAGVRICKINLYGFDIDMTYIREFGDYSSDDLKAYGYHMLLSYQLESPAMKPRVSVEYSFASGDSDPTDGNHETFDGAFGARDKMYGRMNLFHWKNLKDAQVNLEVKLWNRYYVKAEFHKVWLAEERDAWYLNAEQYRDKTGKSGDAVGKELDIVFKTDLPSKNEIQLGYGHFWPDEFAENKACNKQADWLFLQWRHQLSWGLL